LHPWRAARMNDFHARNSSLPGFDEVLEALMDATWYAERAGGVHGAIQRQTAFQVLKGVGALAADSGATAATRAQAMAVVDDLGAWLDDARPGRSDDTAWVDHYAAAKAWIDALDRNAASLPGTVTPPPGSPIGG